MPRAALYAIGAAGCAAVALLTATLRPSGDDASALDGAALFTAKGCAACHDGPDGPSMSGVGPSLAAAPEWASDRVGGLSAAAYLEQSMRSPSAFISPAWERGNGPTIGMPLLRLSDAEIDAIVAYLLQRTTGGA
jgi:mono/diheme cytochrome c family protein